MSWIHRNAGKRRTTAVLAAGAMAVAGLVALPPVGAAAALDEGEFVDQTPYAVDGDGERRPLECSAEGYPGGVAVNPGSSTDLLDLDLGTSQTFVPSIGRIDRIELCLTPVLSGEDVEGSALDGGLLDAQFDVVIHQVTNDGGPIDTRTGVLSLAGATVQGVLAQETAWYGIKFDPRDQDGDGTLDQTVFTPGATYAIELADPSIQFIWRATCGGDAGSAAAACSDTSPDSYPLGEGRSALSEEVAVGDFGFRTISTLGPDLIGAAIAPLPRVVCPDLSTFESINVTITNAGDVSVGPSVASLTARGPGNATPVDLGSVQVSSLAAGQSVAFALNEFSSATDLEQVAGIGDVVIRLLVDDGDRVTEVVEDNNATEAATSVMACDLGALVNPTLEVAEDDNVLPHGITRVPFTQLTPEEFAAGSQDFGNQSSTVIQPENQIVEEGEVADAPLFHGPLFHGPLFHGPLFHGSVVDAPLFHGPLFHGPLFHGPLFHGPLFHGGDIYDSPLFHGPLFHGPLFHGPLFHGPLFHGPLFHGAIYETEAYKARFGGNLEVFLSSLPDAFLDQIPLLATGTSPGWAQLIEEAEGGSDALLALKNSPFQSATLLDARDAGLLERVELRFTDLSRAMRLSPGNSLLANVQLGQWPALEPYDRPDGTNDLCAMITDASHLDCAGLIAKYGSLESITMLQLSILEGANLSTFPVGSGRLADFDVVEDPATGLTGNLAYDLPVANVDFRSATDASTGLPLELPAQGHSHLYATALGSRPLSEVVADTSIVDCAVLAADRGFDPADAETCLSHTIAQVEESYAFAAGADMGDLIEALNNAGSESATFAGLSPAYLSVNSLPWGYWSSDHLDGPAMQRRLGLEVCTPKSITVSADVDPQLGTVFAPRAHLALPRGFDLHSVTAAAIDGQPVDLEQDVIVDAGDPLAALRDIDVTIEAIAEESYSVTVAVCASDTLGEFNVRHSTVEWETFVLKDDAPPESAPDFDIEGLSLGADEVVTLEVVEAEEDFEAPQGTSVNRVNTLVQRHITPGESDAFRIPTTGLVDGAGRTIDLVAGDVVNVYMVPPPGYLREEYDDEGQQIPVPFGGVDLDMAGQVLGTSSLLANSVGLTDDFQPSLADEPAKFSMADNTVVEGPDGSVSPSALNHSPLFHGPLFHGEIADSPLFHGSEDQPAFANSNNRGDAPESISLRIEPGQEGSDILVEVDGVFDAADVRSYELWISVSTLGAAESCTPVFEQADIPFAPPTAVIPDLAPGDETLILFNEQVANATYGSVAELPAVLANFAARPEVNGVVVNPMADDAYEGAMRSYLTTPTWCRPETANGVAGQVRRIVQQARQQTVGPDGTPTLKYVMVFGDDAQQPYWRLRDDRPIGNARDLAYELLTRTRQNNPLLAAAAEGWFITDDPMVSSVVRLDGANPVFLPDVVSSRVIGTPIQMIAQIAAWAATGNTGGNEFDLGDGDSLVTGEGPFSDGAVATADDLELLGFDVDRSLINPESADPATLSTADDLRVALRVGAEGDGSPEASFLFQHADPWRLQSSYGYANGIEDVVRAREISSTKLTGDATDDLRFGHVVAALSCNFNQQVPAVFYSALRDSVGSSSGLDLTTTVEESVEPAWADVLAVSTPTISWVGATSYGYGVSPGIDLTEAMVLLTEQFMSRGLSFGEAVLAAKRRQYVGQSDYDGYNYKALATFQVNGFPMTVQSDAAPFDPESIFSPPIDEVGDGVLATAALQSPDLAVAATPSADCQECLRRIDVIDGTYYTAVTSNTFGGEGSAGGSPVTPTVTTGYDFGDRLVSGVLVTAIDSEFAPGVAGDPSTVNEFDFVYGTRQVSGGSVLPSNNGIDVNTVGVRPNVTRVDGVTYVTMARAQARGLGVRQDGEVVGSYRLDTKVNGELLFAPEGEEVPLDPARTVAQTVFRNPEGTVAHLEWTVEHRRPMHRAVGAIEISDGTSTEWLFLEGAKVPGASTTGVAGDGSTFHVETFQASFVLTAQDEILEHVTQTVDSVGRVNWSRTETLPQPEALDEDLDPLPPVEPHLVVEGDLLRPAEGGQLAIYGGDVRVTLDNEPDTRFDVRLDGSPFLQVRGGFSTVLSGVGRHEVVAKSQYGTEEFLVEFLIDDAPPTITPITPFLPDVGESPQVFFTYGDVVPIEFECADDLPGVECREQEGRAVLDTDTATLDGPRLITLVAVDIAGRETVVQVPYLVRSGLTVTQFDRPIDGDIVRDENGLILVPQTYDQSGSETVPFKFTVTAPSGQPLGLLPTGSFTWTLIDPVSGPAGFACEAYSNPGYRLKGNKHHFNAVTECTDASGEVTRDFEVGERWRFNVTLPDGLRLYADVTIT